MESEREKQILCNIAYLWDVESDTGKLTDRTEIESWMKRTNLQLSRWGRGSGMNWENEINMYALLCIKYITNEKLLFSTGNFIESSAVT